MGQQLVKQDPAAALVSYIASHEQAIAAAVPAHISAKTIIDSCTATMRAEPKLAKCSKESLVKCLRRAALTGLSVGEGAEALASFVPYGNEAKFQIGYKGYRELVRRARQGELRMEAVYEGDTFVDNGPFQLPTHPRGKGRRRYTKVTGCYAVFIPTTGGAPAVNYWSVEDCVAHRDKFSKGYNGARNKKEHPWHEDHPGFATMCKKTALLSLVNEGLVPLSVEVSAIAREEMYQEVAAATREQLPPGELAATHAAKQLEEQTPPEVMDDDAPADAPLDTPTTDQLADYFSEADDPDKCRDELLEGFGQWIDGDIRSAYKTECRKRNEESQ